MTTMNAGMSTGMHQGHIAGMALAAGEARATSTRRVVYVIRERNSADGPKSFWTKVGVAFENRDGSLSVRLDALPLDGTLQIRDEDKDQARRNTGVQAPF